MMPFLMGMLTGGAFGAVLYKVGAVRYSRVMGMLTLRDVKIMKFAFTGIATASLLYGLAAALGVAEAWNLTPRVMPFLGLAHIVGGTLFGLGMGVSGLCPGTCVAKAGGRAGAKAWTGTASMLGLLAGVLLYNVLKDPLTESGIIAVNQKPYTLHGVLGLPYATVALVWGALFVVVVTVLDRFLPEKDYTAGQPRSLVEKIRGEWTWLAGGVAGGVIIVLATAQGGYLGFSGAMLAFTGWVAHLVGMPLAVVPAMGDDILWRAALIVGVFPGAMLAAALSIKPPEAAVAPVKKVLDVKALGTAFGAGTVMCLGAMIGGGCTTGAFISAWPTLSLGSLAMAGTFFVVSMVTSNIRLMAIKSLNLGEAQVAGQRAYD